MILVGSQRGNSQNLALHLMKDENERVQVHEIRGFVANDLEGAFQESYAISRGTRCKQHLYSLSLSPPKDADCDDAMFISAIDRAEERLGLMGQPRAIVFHEKRGADGDLRRHAHAVWCRIDIETMTAKQISFDRTKLNALARDLYIEHDWHMPRGFVSKTGRDPANYSLSEWQQAKRAEKDPKQLKMMFQDCWAISDSKAAFAHALKERGYILAKGDRRGFVAVDYKGEAYAISRWVGKKAKEIKVKLRTAEDLPSVQQAHATAAQRVADHLKALEAQQRAKAESERAEQEAERQRQAQREAAQKKVLQAVQAHRRKEEDKQRAANIRTGWRGLLDKLTGRRKKIEQQNLQAQARARKRDEAERFALQKLEAHKRDEAARRAAFMEKRRRATVDELREDRRSLQSSFSAESSAAHGQNPPNWEQERRQDKQAVHKEPEAARNRDDRKAAFKEQRQRRARTPTAERPRRRSRRPAPDRSGPAPEL